MTDSDDFVEDPAPTQDDFVADDFTEDQTPEAAPTKERTPLEKAGRIASQFAIGAAQGTVPVIAYEIGVAPANTQAFHVNEEQARLGEDIEYLYEKNAGTPFEQWSDQDKAFYESFSQRINNPEQLAEEGEPIDISLRGLAEKATGVNLQPEGVLEKAANWIGFVKDPKKVQELFTLGLSPNTIAKAIFPYPKDIFRGLGAGTAMQLAEDGQFGPLGTLGMAILGDVIGHGPTFLLKKALNPKQTVAELTNLLTMNNTKRLAAIQLAEDFAKSNLIVDAGTLTGSPIVQMMQARLAQSGLTGTALENFRKELSGQIVKEYDNIVGDVGELTFENNYQAGEAIKDALRINEVALNTDLNKPGIKPRSLKDRATLTEEPQYQQDLLNKISAEETNNSYVGGEELKKTAEEIREPFKQDFKERWKDLNEKIGELDAAPQAELAHELETFISENQGSLLLGSSNPEAKVLRAAINLLSRLQIQTGSFLGVRVSDLIKTKRTLSDIVNWEFAGSNFESSFKKIVGDISEAIDRALAENPELRSEYRNLNADYTHFKNTFENKNVEKLFQPKNNNFNSIYNDFITNPDKLRSLEYILQENPNGVELLNKVKRDYAQRFLGPNMSSRDIRELQQVLGPEFDPAILDYIRDQKAATEQPSRFSKGQPLGINVQLPQTKPTNPTIGRKVSTTGTEAARAGVRKKMYDAIVNKKPEDIMKQMDTISGIKKLREALETTPEGKQLFKELSRYKLAEMIDKKMTDAVNEQVKLGKFSTLLQTKNNRDIAKELMSPQAFNRLEALQKNSGKLAQSAAKFFNASQSGTTMTDVGLIGAAASGVMLGNVFMAVPAMLKMGGSYVIAQLLADPVFLKELEKAISASSEKKFQEALKNMSPTVYKALKEYQSKYEQQGEE